MDQYFSPAELQLLRKLALGDATSEELRQSTRLAGADVESALGDLVAMGWIVESQQLYSINRAYRAARSYLDFVSALINLPPHVASLRTYVANHIQQVSGEPFVKSVRVIGSYGTNDYIHGVSDIDLVVVFNDELARSHGFDAASCLNGQVDNTKVEVWDIPLSAFEQLASNGRFFALWVIHAGMNLYGDYYPRSIGRLNQSNLALDIERDFILALGKKLVETRSEKEVLNTFVNLTKRASVVFGAYITGYFTRDGLVAARNLGFEREYLRVLDAKRSLTEGCQSTLEEFATTIRPFHRGVYSKYLSVDQRQELVGRVNQQIEELRGAHLESAETLALLVEGYGVFRTFFE